MTQVLETQGGAQLLRLENERMRLLVTNFGASVFGVQRREGDNWVDLCLSGDNLTQFTANRAFLGATVGRVANRIARGRFSLGGKVFQLPLSDGNNSAQSGFATRLWETAEIGDDFVTFSLESPDGDEGYPGSLSTQVEYRLREDVVSIVHRAVSDAETIVNYTNHTYWCLDGPGEQIGRQTLRIFADFYLPCTEELIPTGEILQVAGTPFDFRAGRKLEASLSARHPFIQRCGGIDVSFVRRDSRTFGPAAELTNAAGTRVLEVWSDYPDLHLYTGNFLAGTPGKGGSVCRAHDGLCLEAERFPDAVNQSHFGAITLAPGERYCQRIEFRFRDLAGQSSAALSLGQI